LVDVKFSVIASVIAYFNSFLTNIFLVVCGKRGIPLNFIKSISEEELSAKMLLKVSWGSSWPIKICRNPSFYFMEKKGWDQFLSDNGLGNDEFLTFTHQGNMCFTVDIYQVDGKELLTPRRSATIASSSGKYFIYVIAFLMLKEKNEEEDSA